MTAKEAPKYGTFSYSYHAEAALDEIYLADQTKEGLGFSCAR